MKTFVKILQHLLFNQRKSKTKISNIYKVHIKGSIMISIVNMRYNSVFEEELKKISLQLLNIKRLYEELGAEITSSGNTIVLEIYSKPDFLTHDKDYITKLVSLLSECFSGISKNMYFLQVDLKGIIENVKVFERFHIYNEDNIVLIGISERKKNSLAFFLHDNPKI